MPSSARYRMVRNIFHFKEAVSSTLNRTRQSYRKLECYYQSNGLQIHHGLILKRVSQKGEKTRGMKE